MRAQRAVLNERDIRNAVALAAEKPQEGKKTSFLSCGSFLCKQKVVLLQFG
jgi:hypothetical protein